MKRILPLFSYFAASSLFFPLLNQAAPVFYYPEPHPPSLTTSSSTPMAHTRTPRSGKREWLYHKTSDGQHPDGNEQAMLWLTNIARANPPAEGIWLATATTPDIANGRNYFNVDTAMLRSEFDSYTPTPPAAFDARLYRAAYNHSLDLIARDAQDHDGQFERIEAQGFVYANMGGNVFAYASSSLNAHAALNIDWGAGPGNMQTGRGHRVSKMSLNKNYANIGIAMVAENNSATRVGPYVVTENYATAGSWINDGTHYNRFLVGTIWEDKNNNARYDHGEGFGNVRIQPDQGDYYAISANSGGYALPLTAEGVYHVTFSGGPFSQPVSKQISVGTHSVLLDYQWQSSVTTYPLSVSTSGNGSVTSAPSGISCGSDCSENYAGGTAVTLTATPANGYIFSAWNGACSGTQTTCTVTMNAAQSVSASFNAAPTNNAALVSGVAVHGALSQNEWRHYMISADASHTQLRVELFNLSGDIDLFVQKGAPITDRADCISDAYGTEAETCTLANNAATTWHIALYAYESSNYSLNANLSGALSNSARLVNISTRANVSGGQNDAFAGFVLSGTNTQQIMLRGIAAASGIDPALVLLKRNGTAWESVAANDEWEQDISANNIRALAANLRLPDSYGNDAGMLLHLGSGVYSAQLSSRSHSGLAVVGVDALSDAGAVLTNISTRAYISGGQNDAFAGFIISGSGTLKVMLRGIAAASGVNPKITLLRRNGTAWEAVDNNDDWEDHISASAIRALASNLQLPDGYDGYDAGMLLNLPAGVYSLQLSSISGSGLAVVGVDAVP
jgi:uncharacterized protein YkwD